MNPHIKKLSVLFLIAAVTTSSLALGVSAFIDLASNKNNPLQQEGATYDPTSPDGYRIYGAGPNGQNLTEEVTDIFARQLVNANPEGPLQDEDGSVMMLSPTSTELVSYLASNPPSESILTAPIDDSRIQVIKNFDTSDVSHYLSEILQLQNDISSNPIWQSGLSTTTIDGAISANITVEANKIFTEAQDKAYSMKVPEPFVSLHKSEMAFFSTMTSFSNMVIQDPVAAMSLSNNLDKIISRQSDQIEQSVKDLQTNFPEFISILPQKDGSALANILGIQIAHATLVEDIAHWAISIAEWARKFWEDYGQIIMSTALGTLKNFLIQMIGQKIITWAEGAGVPGYVTNWGMFALDAGLSAKFGLISKQKAKLCGSAATSGLYGDVLASALGAPEEEVGVTGVTQTVGETPGCPSISSGFYQRGGHSPEYFLQSLTNNVYGDLLTLKDQSMRAAGAASQAAVNEGLSGRGSLDVKKCDDGTAVDSDGLCEDGEPARTVTPGSAKQELISKALGGAQDIIASVNNQNMYAAIVQALTQAIVNYALQEGQGIFENSGSSGGPPPPPPPSSTIAQQLTWYSNQLGTALALATGAKTNSEQAKSTFRAILDGAPCAETYATEIQGNIAILDESLVTLNARRQEIQDLIDAVNQLRQNPPVTQAQLDAIGSTASIIALVTRSRGDNETAATVLNAANELFSSPECAIQGP